MPPELEQLSTREREAEAGDIIRRVAAEVLEMMFFTEAEVATCEHAWLESASCARARFAGSHLGEMLLGISVEAAAPTAAYFLGLEPMEVTEAQRSQVLQELTNILCGAMLSQIWPESKLTIAPPELTGWREWPDAQAMHRCFVIPEGKLAISIRLIAAATPVGQPGIR
jgi:Chemotaxis phosphatase CheX